jgi:uncharacterized small protein (DUF1192 family)
MGGNYAYIWSAWDPGVSPEDRKERLMEQAPVKARTHGCSCCSSEEVLTVKDLEAHIAALKKNIAEAEAIKSKLMAWEARLAEEQEIRYEEGRGAGIEDP